MASFTFDSFGFWERPSVILCNPDKTELYSLGNIKGAKLILKFNALSEFSFTLAQTIQDSGGNNVIDPAYALLKAKRLIRIENFGYFQITNVEENLDGFSPSKSVQASSLEVELVNKQINGFTTDSIKFYDPEDITGTFMDLILANTGWTVQDVSPSLWNIYRAIDIPSSSVYNSLMVTAEAAFGCIFSFDTESKSVNVTGIDDSTYNTDVFISFNNLMKQATMKEITEEVVTVMNVFGGGDLDIRSVNPLGTNKIYNFSYYMDTNWMPQSLINAINAWNTKINNNQVAYSALLTQLRTQYIQLSVLQATLSTQQDELAALIEVKKVQVQGSQDLTAINAQITAKNAQITTTTTAITNKNAQIVTTNNQIIAINNLLALTNTANFTTTQLNQLKQFMYENVYQNQNIITTSIMSPAEIQDQAQELYDQAKSIMSRVSQPRYEFSMDVVNLFALREFQAFGDALNLGALVTIELKENEYIYTGLLEIDLNFDQLNDFQMVFSNRLRLDNGSYIYSDWQINTMNAGISVDYNQTNWGKYVLDKPNILNVDSILNATTNQIVNNSNSQEITINQHGIIGKQETSPGSGVYTGNQIWVTSNSIAFSKNSFQTSGLALGQITWNNQTVFGIVGDAIIGRILAGNQLTIQDTVGSFIVDNAGVRITNGSVTISNTKNTISLNPQVGISMTKNSNGSNIFSLDGNGNLVIVGAVTATSGSFTGSITSNSGSIGGWIINSTGISKGNNFINSDGTMTIGPLSITGPSTGSFSGTFQASKLIGQINGTNQIQDNTITSGKIISLRAEKIDVGVLTGQTLFGGTIYWGGTSSNPKIKMFGQVNPITGETDVALLQSQGVITMQYVEPDTYVHNIGTGELGISNLGVKIFGDTIEFGDNGRTQQVTRIYGKLDLSFVSSITTPLGNGYTGSFSVNTANGGVKLLTYSRGLLYSVT